MEGGAWSPEPSPGVAVEGGGQEDFLRNKLVMGHWGVPVLVVGWRLGVAVTWGSAFSFAVLRQHLLGGGQSRPSWRHHRAKKQGAKLWGETRRVRRRLCPPPAPRHTHPSPSCVGGSLAQLLPPPPPPRVRSRLAGGCAGGRWGWGASLSPPHQFPWQPCRTPGRQQSRLTGRAGGTH